MAISDLGAKQIQEALTTAWVGQRLYFWPVVGSTMDEARRLADAGAGEGTVVIADQQAAGRGRLRRTWWAPPGSSLLLTLLLRPDLPPRRAQQVVMLSSLAMCEAIARVCGLEAAVKWPNDVLIGGKKVCGILTELGVSAGRLEYVLLGIGINVNLDWKHSPPLTMPATSLSAEVGHEVSRLDLLAVLLEGIERRCEALRRGQSFHHEWAGRLVTIGQPVQVSDDGAPWSGLAEGVDEDGALLVRMDGGARRRVLAGDVTLRATAQPREARA